MQSLGEVTCAVWLARLAAQTAASALRLEVDRPTFESRLTARFELVHAKLGGGDLRGMAGAIGGANRG